MAAKYSGPYQVHERQRMLRLELGEAWETGDFARAWEIMSAMNARGDRDISYELNKGIADYYEFERAEEKRASAFVPLSADQLVEQIRVEPTRYGGPAEPEPEPVVEAEAELEPLGNTPDYNSLKIEHSLAEAQAPALDAELPAVALETPAGIPAQEPDVTAPSTAPTEEPLVAQTTEQGIDGPGQAAPHGLTQDSEPTPQPQPGVDPEPAPALETPDIETPEPAVIDTPAVAPEVDPPVPAEEPEVSPEPQLEEPLADIDEENDLEEGDPVAPIQGELEFGAPAPNAPQIETEPELDPGDTPTAEMDQPAVAIEPSRGGQVAADTTASHDLEEETGPSAVPGQGEEAEADLSDHEPKTFEESYPEEDHDFDIDF